MSTGLDNLKHLVVLMMENRSFDHMFGGLKAIDPRVDGLAGSEDNPDAVGGTRFPVQPLANYQGQLDPDPDHDFDAVDQQIFNGGTTPTMEGFIANYYQQQQSISQSRKIMYYFKPAQLPILTTLAQQFALFNRWFASIPGPTLCNRAFAHYGTSFGNVGMDLLYANTKYKSIYSRVIASGKKAKLYYYDLASSSLEVVNLLKDQPEIFGTYQQFLDDCTNGALPDYSFIEPNYKDHPADNGGQLIASDQHPDHDVLEGERFIASIYQAIRKNANLWPSTALLITYDEHGGIFDHVPPPSCPPDGFVAQPKDTNTGKPFSFDRLGVRVPAIFVSPWIAKGTIVDEGQAEPRVFEHASIPATVTQWLLPGFDNTQRSPREAAAATFLDLLTDNLRTDTEVP